MRPSDGSSTSVPRSDTLSPSGSDALSSTGIVTTPPVRTATSTSRATGARSFDSAAFGMTRISPVDSVMPFETVYRTFSGPSSRRVAVMRSSS